MEIVLRGSAKDCPKKHVRKAAGHFADVLMNKRLHENIHVTIILGEFKGRNKDSHGECVAHYDDNNIARIFEIRLANKLNFKDILLALAHVMCHLKQYATNQWYEYNRTPNRHRFNGQILDLDKDENDDDYWLAPWEIEAFGIEYGLYRSYKNQEFRYEPS